MKILKCQRDISYGTISSPSFCFHVFIAYNQLQISCVNSKNNHTNKTLQAAFLQSSIINEMKREKYINFLTPKSILVLAIFIYLSCEIHCFIYLYWISKRKLKMGFRDRQRLLSKLHAPLTSQSDSRYIFSCHGD